MLAIENIDSGQLLRITPGLPNTKTMRTDKPSQQRRRSETATRIMNSGAVMPHG